MKLNDKILYCRKKAVMSQEALAEKLGVSRQAISKWECGTAAPELENLYAISKLFGVTTDWLLNDEASVEDEEQSDQNSDDSRKENESKKYEPPRSERTYQSTRNDSFENLPRVLAKGVKRFGWLLGVYISCLGAGIAGIGGLMKFIVNRMVSSISGVSSSLSPFGSFSEPQIEISGDIPAGLDDKILAEIYGSSNAWEATRYEYGAFESFTQNNPVSIVATFMIVIGIIMIVGGIVTAIMLKRMGEKE